MRFRDPSEASEPTSSPRSGWLPDRPRMGGTGGACWACCAFCAFSPSRLLAARTVAPERLAFFRCLRRPPSGVASSLRLGLGARCCCCRALLSPFFKTFKAYTLSGCSVRCSRGPATGGKPPGGTTRSLLLLPRALPRAAAGTGGAGERTMILKVGPTAPLCIFHHSCTAIFRR